MQKQQTTNNKFFLALSTLVLALVYLIVVLGCEEKTSESSADPVDNYTAPHRIVVDTIKSSSTTSTSIAISWEAPTSFGQTADGKDAKLKSYRVYYAEGSTVTTSTAGVQMSNEVQTTSITISGLTPNTEYAFIIVTTNTAGKTSVSTSKSISTIAADINLNDFELSYEISKNAVFGEEQTYSATTTIPAGANASYTIGLTTDGNEVAGISISTDGATITVADTTVAGTHELTVTASTASSGYTGTKTAAITIIVEKKSIASEKLEYDTGTNAIYSEEKTYSATTNTIVDEASAIYFIVLTADGSAVPGISISTDAVITVGDTTVAGTHELTVSASATSTNYTGTTKAEITIIVDKKSIASYEFGYNTIVNAEFGVKKSYAVMTTIPSGANVTYTIGLTTDETAVAGISISQEDATITVGDTTAKGSHDLTVKAITGNDVANYTGIKTAVITITVDPASTKATAPEKATALNTKDVSNTAITLEWVAPQDMGKAADGIATANLREYKVYYKEGATVSIVDGTLFQGTNTIGQDTITAIISGLKGLTEYAFIVVTVNSEGKSSISETITATTTSAASAPILARINPIETIDITKDSIEISWIAPDDLGKADDGSEASLKGYKVYYKEGDTVSIADGTLLNQDINEGVQDNTTAKISGLQGLTKYAIIVETVNSADKSSTSLVATETTKSAASAPSAAIINPVDDNSITYTEITISWTAPVDMGKADDGSTDATITGYKVYYKEGDTVSVADGTLLNANPDGGGGVQAALTATISGLTAGTKYAFMVESINSADKRSTSLVTTATTGSAATPPSHAIEFNPIDTFTSSSITISWYEGAIANQGKEADGSAATLKGYQVYYKEGDTVSVADGILFNENNNEGFQTALTATISGLQELSTYAFIVVTTNSADLSIVSEVLTKRIEILFIKLGSDGQALSNQDGTWSESGTEDAGTKWSCVRANRGTKDPSDDLYWEIKTDDGGARDKDHTYKWGGLTAVGINDATKEGTYHNDWDTLVNAANDAANNGANGLCGFDDWRVPTLEEATDLYRSSVQYETGQYGNSSQINTKLFPIGVTKVGYSEHWAVSPTSNSEAVWYDSSIGFGRNNRDNAYYVRLIRDGKDWNDAENSYTFDLWPDSRYTNNGDGTITDSKTKLMWMQCTEGYSGDDCSTESTKKTFTYDEALAHATTLNETGFSGHTDWRLPTQIELISLVAHNRENPAINGTMFPNTISGRYRTSVRYTSFHSHVIEFDKGQSVYNESSLNTHLDYVRLVRSTE